VPCHPLDVSAFQLGRIRLRQEQSTSVFDGYEELPTVRIVLDYVHRKDGDVFVDLELPQPDQRDSQFTRTSQLGVVAVGTAGSIVVSEPAAAQLLVVIGTIRRADDRERRDEVSRIPDALGGVDQATAGSVTHREVAQFLPSKEAATLLNSDTQSLEDPLT
jgi:hypothetical protein